MDETKLQRRQLWRSWWKLYKLNGPDFSEKTEPSKQDMMPGIRVVTHKGMSSSLLDYAQDTGRGGRDGQTVWCITVLNDSYCEQYISSEEEDEREKREMYEMRKSAKCYREISCEIVDDGDASDDFLMEEFALPELEMENIEQEYFHQQRRREPAPVDEYQVEDWDVADYEEEPIIWSECVVDATGSPAINDRSKDDAVEDPRHSGTSERRLHDLHAS
ncbi:unnamed protein product [Umbelopsis vinacea]